MIDLIDSVTITMLDPTGIKMGIQSAVLKAVQEKLRYEFATSHSDDRLAVEPEVLSFDYSALFEEYSEQVEAALSRWIEDNKRIQIKIDLTTGYAAVLPRRIE